MWHFRNVLAMAVSGFCVAQWLSIAIQADLIDLVAAEDARVLSFSPNSNEGNGNLLSIYNDGGSNVQRTFIKFDMSAYTGKTAAGDGRLTFFVSANGAGLDLLDGELFLAAGSWMESSITWNTQPPLDGAALSSAGGSYNVGEALVFFVPQAILQSLLDDPANNKGFAIVSGAGSTIGFDSREFGGQQTAPRLSFNIAIPEPGAAMVLLVLAAGAFWTRRGNTLGRA